MSKSSLGRVARERKIGLGQPRGDPLPCAVARLCSTARPLTHDVSTGIKTAEQILVQQPKSALQLRNTARARLLPTRESMLDALRQHGIGAEIGVAGGDFTSEILRRCAPRRLHLIDSWLGPRYGYGFELVYARFQRELAAGTAIVNRGMSIQVLSGFPEAYFDWV